MSPPAADTMEGPLEVAGDHPSFTGHFPSFPVLPGAVLLDEALQVIQRARRIDLQQWRIASVKFQGAVRPGDALRLEHTAPRIGAIHFTVRTESRIIATGSLSVAPRPGASRHAPARPGGSA